MTANKWTFFLRQNELSRSVRGRAIEAAFISKPEARI
jgi:hypothetical protein